MAEVELAKSGQRVSGLQFYVLLVLGPTKGVEKSLLGSFWSWVGKKYVEKPIEKCG